MNQENSLIYNQEGGETEHEEYKRKKCSFVLSNRKNNDKHYNDCHNLYKNHHNKKYEQGKGMSLHLPKEEKHHNPQKHHNPHHTKHGKHKIYKLVK